MNPYLLKIIDKPTIQEFSCTDNFWINSKIHEHARKRDPDYYVENRAAEKDKVISDILIGIKGEFAVAWLLNAKYSFPLMLPDLRILPKNKKGWDADLPYKNVYEKYPNVHVKTCRYSTRWAPSWVFQFKNADGSLGRDAILNTTSYDLVAFVVLQDDVDWKPSIFVILPWIKLKPYLREPRLQNKKGIKKCIYYADLMRDKVALAANTAPVA